ncbi:signal transduction histidine kinase [Filimonas zeae]|nr:7TM diverse intracellular signaling domain-containing protein [Filimonas zeae]MDR6342596.1 signal transduction histidine kinase [Filimonas zeae]
MRMKKWWVVFSAVLLNISMASTLLASDSTIIVTSRQSEYSFHSNNWLMYKTNNSHLPFSSVLQQYAENRFSPVKAAVLNGGIAKKYYWFHFAIRNEDTVSNQMVIDIQSPRLNELELFEVSTDSSRSLGKLGDFYPFEERGLLHKNFQYVISLDKAEKKEYFLYVNQIGHTLLLPIRVYKRKAFESTVNQNYLTDGITYGLLLFVTIFSFLFYINTRHKLYLYYGLYILTSIIWFLGYFGLGFEFVWNDYPALNTMIAPVFSSLNMLLNIQISQVLLDTRNRHPWLCKIGNLCKAGLIVVAIVPLFVNLNNHSFAVNNAYLSVFLTVILISILVVLYSLIASLVKGTAAARYYFIASIIKVSGIFNLALLEWGLAPASFYTETMLQSGILIEIVLLTYAIARRYTSYKIRTYRKIIQAQESERFNTAKEIHDGISGTLTAIRFNLLNLSRNAAVAAAGISQNLVAISEDVGTAQVEARNISHNLMPAYIKNNSLNRVIDLYIQDIQQKKGDQLDIQFTSKHTDEYFSEDVRLSIFRIIQEIMTNIIKHAQASAVNIEFMYRKKDLLITVEDNGVGIDTETLKIKKGIGIRNIESRVQLLNGIFHITSGKKMHSEMSGTGTYIFIRIPNTQQSKWESRDY